MTDQTRTSLRVQEPLDPTPETVPDDQTQGSQARLSRLVKREVRDRYTGPPRRINKLGYLCPVDDVGISTLPHVRKHLIVRCVL